MALLRSGGLTQTRTGVHPQQAGMVPQSRGAHPTETQRPRAPLSAEDAQMELQGNTGAITVKHSGLQVSGIKGMRKGTKNHPPALLSL